MKRLVWCCSILSVLTLAATRAEAQRKATSIIGIGADVPMTDYKDDSAKTGYQLMAGVEMPFFTKVTALRVDGMLGWNGRETNFRESNYLAGIYARLVWWVPAKLGSVSPYALGGIGYLYNKYNAGQAQKFSTSHSEAVYGVGAGAEVPVGPLTTFVEARYDYGADVTRFYPIIVGLRFKPGS